MARDANVKVVLSANDQASGPLKNFQNTIRGVRSEMGDVNDMAGMLKGGIAGIAAAAGIGALQELGGQMMDLGRAGESFGMLRASFDDLAGGVGQSSDAMLAAMREAAGGMIADQELILAGNRAMMLGVADSSAELAQLLEVAAVRGRAMGMSTSQAFNDLVTGLGRMSPLILDNLGIVTGGEKVFEDYAKSIGKAADSLTDAERKQALLNKVISETDTSGEVMVSQFERMDAALANAKIAMGELFGPAVAAVAQQIADATNQAVGAVKEQAAIQAHNDMSFTGGQITEQVEALQHAQMMLDNALIQEGQGSDQYDKWRMNLDMIQAGLVHLAQKYNEAAQVTNAPLIDVDAIKTGVVAFDAATVGLTTMNDAAGAAASAGASWLKRNGW